MKRKNIFSQILLSILVLTIVIFSVLPCFANINEVNRHPKVLFLSAYAYDWDSVPYQLDGFTSVLNGKAKMNYIFMNTKKHSYDYVKDRVYKEVQEAMAQDGKYDVIVVEDDAALDFALEYRNDLFKDMPIVFMGINTAEKGNLAHKDPLITGMIESFPYKDTIALAEKINPKATKIVGITDNTESGKGVSKRFLDEAKNFPELEFSQINASELTEAQLKKALSELDNSSILMFLALVNDADGNIYSLMEATEFVAENVNIPMFKADMLGVGEGVFGGYVSSYRDMGKSAGEQTLEILNGKSPAEIPVETMGGYPYFDQKMIDRFKIDEKLLPQDSVIENHVPSFYEMYKNKIWAVTLVIAFLMIIGVSYLAITRVKANRKLKLALEKADEANRAKTDFLARMSHDMRTPMNGILGLSYLMEDQENIDEIKEDIPKLRKSGEYLLQLINDVLDVNKVESGNVELHPKLCDEKQVFDSIIAMIKPQLDKKNIKFNFIKKNINWCNMLLDEQRVKQIFVNILSNAVKFTPEGGKIDFIMELVSEENGIIRDKFIIRDNGIGMSEAFLPEIFKPFSQENRVHEDLGGTGLGLSIVKSLVELMGGTITVNSKINEGSEFTLFLNFPVANDSNVVTSKLENAENSFLPENLKILLCEDHPLNAQIAIRLFKKKNAVVKWVDNGQKGVEAFSDSEINYYDVILMDIRMPIMDGIEAARNIRQMNREDARTVPIIAMTANAYEEDVQKSIEAGMDAHLSKPIEPDKMFATVADSINNKKGN